VNLPWAQIDTVMLDMDGTLLDLNFDNHFWQEHVPLRYAQHHGMQLRDARDQLYTTFREIEGTMNWYCLDYWSRELDLDIEMLKREVRHLIGILPHVKTFLDGLRAAGKHILLVTNAHQKSLLLKMEETQLSPYFDHIICAHDLGMPKEEAAFWDKLREQHPFDPQRTLFVDDSLSVLRSAQQYGIQHLLAVRKPDTMKADKDTEEFNGIDSFADILQGL